MFRKKRSIGIRVWHWGNAATVALLLLTVFIRREFHNVRTNTQLFKAKLEASGAAATEQQARALAREIKESFWSAHVYLGYFLAALILGRVAVLFLDRKMPAPLASQTLHFRIVKWTHRIFYLALVAMIGSGLALAFEDSLGLSQGANRLINGLHENLMWFILAFVVAHLCGVVKAELTDDEGLVSEMINGG